MYHPERDLVLFLLNHEYFNRYIDFIDLKHLKEVYKELGYLYQTLQEMHEKTSGKNFSLQELQAYFWSKYPDVDKGNYNSLFEDLSKVEISDDVAESILEDIRTRGLALQLSEQAYKVSSGLADSSSLYEIFSKLEGEVDHTLRLEPVSINLEFLLEQTIQKPGLRWRLQCLNKSLGSLRVGDFGFIFARPETGKTTFLASEISNFLTQTTRPIVWFANEEEGNKVMLRVIQAFFGITVDGLLSNIRKYKSAFEEHTAKRLYMFNDASLSKREVESVIKDLNPELVVYDQLDKVKGFQNDREDLRLGSIYQWAREGAKGKHSAIGVSQSDATGEGVRWLTMDNVANAKTAKQAEADFIMGIGRTHDDAAEFVRYFNISKNKLMGDPDSDPNLRHGRFETLIEPHIARYRDVINYD